MAHLLHIFQAERFFYRKDLKENKDRLFRHKIQVLFLRRSISPVLKEYLFYYSQEWQESRYPMML